jgi:hypothetical protein
MHHFTFQDDCLQPEGIPVVHADCPSNKITKKEKQGLIPSQESFRIVLALITREC